MTDIPRLHTGSVGGQFWSVWVPVDIKGFEAIQTTLEQIDLVISVARNEWDAAEAAERTRFNSPPYVGLYTGQPERAKAALAEWVKDHPRPAVTLAQVADHIEHVRRLAGADHVGLGSDFDGIEDAPAGLEGVDKYPALLVELMKRGWTDSDVAKLAGGNVLHALAEAERVAAMLRETRAASGVTFSPSQPR
jgi:membrane dipeptidase